MEKGKNIQAKVPACQFTSGGYGCCDGCWSADTCPKYQGQSQQVALVHPSNPCLAVGVGDE